MNQDQAPLTTNHGQNKQQICTFTKNNIYRFKCYKAKDVI